MTPTPETAGKETLVERRLSDDKLLRLIHKHFGNARQTSLVNTVWKDGIDIDVPNYQIRNFTNEVATNLRTQLDKAVEALEPFAKLADQFDPVEDDDDDLAWSMDITLRQLRGARSTLLQIKGEKR